MKKNRLLRLAVITLVLAEFLRCVALADNQVVNPTMTSGSISCGKYYAYGKATNSAGGTLITPPTNAVAVTVTDISGYPAPYSSAAAVWLQGAMLPTCASNTVTCSVTNTKQYQLLIYVTSPTPPPTNGQPLTIQYIWQTNSL